MNVYFYLMMKFSHHAMVLANLVVMNLITYFRAKKYRMLKICYEPFALAFRNSERKCVSF